MKFRRHMPPLRQLRLRFPRLGLPPMERVQALRWAVWLGIALLAGYVFAVLFVFPAPLFSHHRVVPRVVGLPLAEARRNITDAKLGIIDNGAEPHPTAAVGTVIWQDPPAGVTAPANLRVALVVSSGPPRVPVPDVAGLDVGLARKLITAAGLTASQVESVQAAVPTGLVMLTRPPAGTTLPPGTRVGLVASRGAPTITVPDVLGLSTNDARTRFEQAGLTLGSVIRRRTTDASPGTIIAQRPGAGTLASPGTIVDIVVARTP
jgi:eukaryotic-like serine/threonine-protein kinase